MRECSLCRARFPLDFPLDAVVTTPPGAVVVDEGACGSVRLVQPPEPADGVAQPDRGMELRSTQARLRRYAERLDEEAAALAQLHPSAADRLMLLVGALLDEARELVEAGHA